MITWTPDLERPDGKKRHSAEIANYRLVVFEGPTDFTWFAYVLRSRFDREHTAFAQNHAPTLAEAQNAARNATIDDIMGTTRTLVTELL